MRLSPPVLSLLPGAEGQPPFGERAFSQPSGKAFGLQTRAEPLRALWESTRQTYGITGHVPSLRCTKRSHLWFSLYFSPQVPLISSRGRSPPAAWAPRASCRAAPRSPRPSRPAVRSRRSSGLFRALLARRAVASMAAPLRHGRPAPPRPALTFSLSPAGDAAALHANEAALMQMRPRPSPPRLRCRRRRGGRGSPGAPPRPAPPRIWRGSSAAGTRSAGHGGGGGRASRARHGAPRAEPPTAATGRGAGSGGRPRGDAGRPEPTLNRDSR